MDSEFSVIGLGQFGVSVARTLTEQGYTVLGIDRNMSVVQEFVNDMSQTVALDSTDEDALRAVDISLFPVVVVAIDNDFHNKLLTTLALKSVGAQRVICTASDEQEKIILLKIGADGVVMPETDSGRRLALSLTMPSLTDHLPIGRGHAVSEVRLPPSLAGTTLRDNDLHSKYQLTLIAIHRGNEVMISPPADLVFQDSDCLVLIGKVSDLDHLGQRQ